MNDTLMSIVLHGVGEAPKMIEEIVLNEIKNLTFEEIKDIIRLHSQIILLHLLREIQGFYA